MPDKQNGRAMSNCPHCGVSLIGDPIPEGWSVYYGHTHWLRRIGIVEDDRVVKWQCPDCGGEWER